MTKQIPREFIDLVLTKIDLVDLIRVNQGIPLQKKSGSNYFACCPFHQEKSPSFSVSHPKQFYYCFGCGARGNAIDFLMQHERLSFPEAIETLARLAGLEIPHTLNDVKKDSRLPALYELMKSVTTDYYDQLRESKRAIDYLKQRGISGSTAKQFSLGYAPAGWNHLLDTFGKTNESVQHLLDAGLIIHKNEGGYYDRFRDRIVFPIHDYRGRIIGFGGRVIDQGEPKYLNSPETILFQKGHELYGLHQALKLNHALDRVLIVEGYMDVIALFQQGITYAVATLGTATTAHHIQRLFRYTTDIIFCFDGDTAGRTAAWRALQVIFPLMRDHLQIRFLFLPDGEDPDTQVQKDGKEAFEKRIQSALSLSDFFFQTLSKQCDMNTLEGRARFATLAMQHIKQLPAGFFHTLLLTELSKRARIDVDQFEKPIPAGETASKTPVVQEPMQYSAPIRLLLALLIQHPSLAALIEDDIPQTILPGIPLFNRVRNIIKENSIPTSAHLIEYWRDKEEESLVSQLAALEHLIPDHQIDQAFVSTLKSIRSQHLQHEIDNLLAKAAGEGLTDQEKINLSTLLAHKKASFADAV